MAALPADWRRRLLPLPKRHTFLHIRPAMAAAANVKRSAGKLCLRDPRNRGTSDKTGITSRGAAAEAARIRP